MVQPLRIARGDVSRHALIETTLRKQPKSSREPFFPMAALLGGRGKNRRARHSFHSRFYLRHKFLPALFAYYTEFRPNVTIVSGNLGNTSVSRLRGEAPPPAMHDDLLDHAPES